MSVHTILESLSIAREAVLESKELCQHWCVIIADNHSIEDEETQAQFLEELHKAREHMQKCQEVLNAEILKAEEIKREFAEARKEKVVSLKSDMKTVLLKIFELNSRIEKGEEGLIRERNWHQDRVPVFASQLIKYVGNKEAHMFIESTVQKIVEDSKRKSIWASITMSVGSTMSTVGEYVAPILSVKVNFSDMIPDMNLSGKIAGVASDIKLGLDFDFESSDLDYVSGDFDYESSEPSEPSDSDLTAVNFSYDC